MSEWLKNTDNFALFFNIMIGQPIKSSNQCLWEVFPFTYQILMAHSLKPWYWRLVNLESYLTLKEEHLVHFKH